ncbi:Trafficking protein particle complex subunit 1 [Diplonema papillatum]|nr:Trafficking protein particle complex subunit 1 [Diplonema papillatum]
MLYSVFIFNKFGTCIFHEDYNSGDQRKGVWVPTPKEANKFKLTAGLVHSVKHFILAVAKKEDLADGFFGLQTNSYKLHSFETATGYRMVMLTDTGVSFAEAKQPLREIYSNAFVEFVAKDPSYEHKKLCVITNTAFRDHLLVYLKQLSFFSTPAEELQH